MKYRNLVLRTFISGVIFSFFLAVSHAEVTLDGTLGPSGLISGPDYMISDDLGQLKGGNLFHSFGIFNAITGESATFTGPNSVENILGRVTGGSASIIDGCLSSQVPGANLFLMNPSGLMFGPMPLGGLVVIFRSWRIIIWPPPTVLLRRHRHWVSTEKW